METSSPEIADLNFPSEDSLPEEFRAPKPRELPQFVKRGRLAVQRHNTLVGCIVAGTICLIFDRLPFVQTLSLYILPLGYLSWIGLGLYAIGVFAHFTARELNNACRYLQEGSAAFGRVLQLIKTPTVLQDGNPTIYAIFAKVAMRHPDTGEPVVLEVKSRDISALHKDKTKTRFRVGDAVPIVWMPNQFDRTAQIYDFLEISPDAALIRGAAKPAPWYQAVATVLAVLGIIFALFWNLYAFGRFLPIDFDYLRQGFWPLIMGAAIGLIAVGAMVIASVWSSRQLAARNLAAQAAGEVVELPAKRSLLSRIGMGLIAPAGGILLGAITVLCWSFSLNAFLDRSPSKPVPVVITNMIQTTHGFFFRDYELKYRRPGDQKDHSLLTTPEHLSQFQALVGIAKVREGWLGWPWIETIEPAPALKN